MEELESLKPTKAYIHLEQTSITKTEQSAQKPQPSQHSRVNSGYTRARLQSISSDNNTVSPRSWNRDYTSIERKPYHDSSERTISKGVLSEVNHGHKD